MGTRTDSNKLFRRVAAMALGAALVVVGGCAEQSEDMGPAAAVSITWGEFDPIAVTVQAGQEVIWRNNPVSVQSVTAVAFRSGTIAPGATFTSTFTVPGTYRYTAAAGTPVGTVIVVP